MDGNMPELWAGIDAGKDHHHCVLIDDEGNRLLSRKVANDEVALTELITQVRALAAGREILWATHLKEPRQGRGLLSPPVILRGYQVTASCMSTPAA